MRMNGVRARVGLEVAAGVVPSAVAARRAVRGRAGAEQQVRAALRSTGRVSSVLFSASLAVPPGGSRRLARLALAGSHGVHAGLIAVYLRRKSGGLPLPLELGGGGVGYACLAWLTADAVRPRGAALVTRAARRYLALLFAGDLAYGSVAKGRDGRPDGPLLVVLLVATAIHRRGGGDLRRRRRG